jgi:hypothetical protein
MRALDGSGPVPSPGDHDKARAMRLQANDLFVLAMDEMKRRAEANKP